MLVTNSEGRSDVELAHIPIVLIDREVERPAGLSSVVCDPRAAISDACAWLTSRGHRRIGLVGGPLALFPGRAAAGALEEAARQAAFETAIAPGPFTAQHGHTGARGLLDLPDPPTALIVGSRQLLPGVLETVAARPDVDIVTFDGDSLLRAVGRPIGVIERQSTETGRVAAELLLRRLAGCHPEARSIASVFSAPLTASVTPPTRRR